MQSSARNKVVLKFGKSIGVVKFLIEQVYCKGVRLAEKFLNAFKRFVSREKSRKAKKKREPLAVSSSSQPMTYGPKTIQQVSKFDLSHRSSVVALSQCFGQVWMDEQPTLSSFTEAVHESHVHSSVRDGWFPIVEGRGRVTIPIQEEGETLDEEVPLRTDFTIKVSSLVLKLGPVSLSIVDVVPAPMREEAFGIVQPLD